MTDTVIKVENLSKKYRIGQYVGSGAQYRTLRESLTDVVSAPLRRLRSAQVRSKQKGVGSNLRPKTQDPKPKTIWALKDVSFEVKSGEVVGIIGRNGAGKSTLLKILTGITGPTEGRAELKGRVSSLLEVGTGFHPELTGRENVRLSGAILGMTRKEIDRKFDEIVDFSGVETYIDTPVKRYSSGMRVRLGFAVAAHLEPEILLVDEVLAMGDYEFQKKCLGKMGDISEEGRTVLLVSHNMTSIVKLCGNAIWLDDGHVRAIDDAEKAVQAYLASGLLATGGRVVFEEPDETKEAYISSVELRNDHDEITSDFEVLSTIKVNIAFCCRRRFTRFRVDSSISRYDGIMIFATTSQDYDSIPVTFEPGTYCVQLLIPGQFLASGEYYLSVNICEPNIKNYDLLASVLRLRVLGDPFRLARNLGFLVYPFEWKLMPLGGDS